MVWVIGCALFVGLFALAIQARRDTLRLRSEIQELRAELAAAETRTGARITGAGIALTGSVPEHKNKASLRVIKGGAVVVPLALWRAGRDTVVALRETPVASVALAVAVGAAGLMLLPDASPRPNPHYADPGPGVTALPTPNRTERPSPSPERSGVPESAEPEPPRSTEPPAEPVTGGPEPRPKPEQPRDEENPPPDPPGDDESDDGLCVALEPVGLDLCLPDLLG